jgi:parvulin-like peptidyl-prolyl isomerase
MLVSQVQRAEVTEKISVTEEEAKAYYAERSKEFTTPSEVTLREILVEVPATDKGINVAQDDEVKARTEAIRARLKAGEPFPRLAADFSAAPSRTNGGLIGPIRYDELAPEFQKLIDVMAVGDVTEPIRTTRGYQLLKLEARTDSRVRSFADARSDIGERVGERKRRGELLKYLDRLRTQATITWRNDELKHAYEQALAKRHESQKTGAPAVQ